VAEIDHEAEGFLYAVAILELRADFWEIEFPALQQAEEALARLLMECSFCQRREVVYLNEMELKSFEVRRCAARLCKHCDAPSIWVEAQSDVSSGEALPSRAAAEERVVPRRNRLRVKARVLACIRQRGFTEEVAVCEICRRAGSVSAAGMLTRRARGWKWRWPYTPRSGGDFRADTDCVFAADRVGGVVPAWGCVIAGAPLTVRFSSNEQLMDRWRRVPSRACGGPYQLGRMWWG